MILWLPRLRLTIKQCNLAPPSIKKQFLYFWANKKLMANNSPSWGLRGIPNLFTLLNLVCGCLAIIFILQTDETIVLLRDDGFTDVTLPEKITWGSLLIFGAAVIDFLDGFIARLFNST